MATEQDLDRGAPRQRTTPTPAAAQHAYAAVRERDGSIEIETLSVRNGAGDARVACGKSWNPNNPKRGWASAKKWGWRIRLVVISPWRGHGAE